jgi:uncharacterized protein YlxW (UPF0749 family)
VDDEISPVPTDDETASEVVDATPLANPVDPDSPEGAAAAGRTWRPTHKVAQGIIAVLAFALGLAFISVVQNNGDQLSLTNATTAELVQILDGVSAERDKLQAEIADLQATRDQLKSGETEKALAEAKTRAEQYAILAGTAKVSGPGIIVTVRDEQNAIDQGTLLDAVQELRDAGAESIQIGNVRVIASTWFSNVQTGVSVSGTTLTSPYRILVIGNPQTLQTALRIPGGFIESVKALGGSAAIGTAQSVTIDAVVPHQP